MPPATTAERPSSGTSQTGPALSDTDNRAILWDLAAGQDPTQLATFTDDNSIYGATWNPTGQLLALAEEGQKATMWDVSDHRNPRRLATMRGQASSVYTVGISPNGQIIGTGGYDRTAILWDITDPHHPNQLASLAGQPDAVAAVRFSPLDKIVAVSSGNDVTLTDIHAMSDTVAYPVEIACAAVGHGLNPTDWAKYVNVPYQQTCHH